MITGDRRYEDDFAWAPDEAVKARAQLTRFLSQAGCPTFEELHRRSVDDVAWFTEEVLRFLDIRFDKPYGKVLDLSRGMPWAAWCVDGKLNITKSCLDRHRESATWDAPAVVWEGEEAGEGPVGASIERAAGAAGGATRTLTYADLHEEVEICAAGLRDCGLGRGDAVGLHLPMMPETVIALLAVGRIGAVAVPLFSGYGPAAIASRLEDVRAKAVFTCDGFPRRGRVVPAKAAVDEALAGGRCPDLGRVFVVRRTGLGIPIRKGRDMAWDVLMGLGASAPWEAREAEETGAEDPLIVLYTSGTTGRPKGILHSHCGFPVKAAQDMAFGTDAGPGDRIAWVTDIGWMMGPWLIYGALLRGAAMVLYDGAPDFPGSGRLWEFCARHRVGILGVSPSLVRALAEKGDAWPATQDLSALRILASTGEPWNPGPWRWLFEKVGKSRLPIINYSGGTEVSGGILMGNPLLPIKPCSFPAPCPGIAADVADPADGGGGRSLRGAVGELVIRKPWIGMARGFRGDPERYLATYWSRWKDTWVHGDWARIDADGLWYILGRSDDTLKVGGKRVGPAEVESVLAGHPAVAEAAVVGVPDERKGQAMIAFCVRASASAEPAGPGEPIGEAVPGSPERSTGAGVTVEASALAEELKARVGTELGKPLQPEAIHFVPALPRTRNAKVMRRIIRAVYLGEDPGDVTALENPEAMEAIRAAGSSGATPGNPPRPGAGAEGTGGGP